jgi:hypothetical protein
MIVDRRDMRDRIASLLAILTARLNAPAEEQLAGAEGQMTSDTV